MLRTEHDVDEQTIVFKCGREHGEMCDKIRGYADCQSQKKIKTFIGHKYIIYTLPIQLCLTYIG